MVKLYIQAKLLVGNKIYSNLYNSTHWCIDYIHCNEGLQVGEPQQNISRYSWRVLNYVSGNHALNLSKKHSYVKAILAISITPHMSNMGHIDSIC